MTHHEATNEANAADEEEVCQHCGAVLDLAHAMQNERSVLRPKGVRASPAPPQAPAQPDAVRASDPSVL